MAMAMEKSGRRSRTNRVMSEQDNIAIARRTWDTWNAHDIEAWLKLLDVNQVLESDTIPAPVTGHDGARAFMQMYITAFPDLRFTVDQIIGSGDYVVSRYTGTGTQKGELAGIPPTGRHAEVPGCTVGEIKNGKLVRQWCIGTRATCSGSSA
jgi:steroid delta-isomerase-like uncharacterized protein